MLGICKNPAGSTPPSDKVTYDGNGADSGSGSVPVDDKRYETGDLGRRGWDFIGWATTQTATTAEHQADDTIKFKEGLTLYAVWRGKAYSISSEKNHARAEGTQASLTSLTFGIAVTNLPTATTTLTPPPAKQFEGWAESSTGTVAPGQYKPTNYEPTITLYAKWEDNPIAGNKIWRSIAMSSNGEKLAAVVLNGNLYTARNSGDNWTNRSTGDSSSNPIAGWKNWASIAMSSDGTKLAAVVGGPSSDSRHIYDSLSSGAIWQDRGR